MFSKVFFLKVVKCQDCVVKSQRVYKLNNDKSLDKSKLKAFAFHDRQNKCDTTNKTSSGKSRKHCDKRQKYCRLSTISFF